MAALNGTQRVVPPALPKKPIHVSAAKEFKYKMQRRNDRLMY